MLAEREEKLEKEGENWLNAVVWVRVNLYYAFRRGLEDESMWVLVSAQDKQGPGAAMPQQRDCHLGHKSGNKCGQASKMFSGWCSQTSGIECSTE